MKIYLFILLTLSISFTQSIQTKEINISISPDDWEGNYSYILPVDEIFELIEGNYKLEFSRIQLLEDNPWFTELTIDTMYGPGVDVCENGLLSYVTNNNFPDNESFKINSNCNDIVISTPYNLGGPPDVEITLWLTGLFDINDDDLQGDMNSDNILNVVDIVAIVNIIIDSNEQ